MGGVTTLIGDGLAKPALINWAANKTAEAAVDEWARLSEMSPTARLKYLQGARYRDLDQAASKGMLIHSLADDILHNRTVEVPDFVAGHVEQAIKFMDDWRVKQLLTETVCYNRAGFYAGTFDLVFTSEFFPGRVFLGDWKTSRSGIYNEAALQLAAYRHAEFFVDANGMDQPMASLGITDTVGIWIQSDSYTVYPLETGDRAFQTFRYVATVARRAAEFDERPLKGEPMSLPTGR
jgi:hypothetical protein